MLTYKEQTKTMTQVGVQKLGVPVFLQQLSWFIKIIEGKGKEKSSGFYWQV